MTKNRFRLALTISFILITCLVSCKKTENGNATGVPGNPSVSVDISATTTTSNSMIGFVHGMNDTDPNSNLITGLKPSYWRAGNLMTSIYPRINQLAAKPIIVISDIYRYPGDNVPYWEQPFANTTSWTDLVTNVYNQASGQSSSFVYDIWNEPNTSYCWTGSRQEFFQTFKSAHDKIRSLPGGQNALIAGPSVNGIDTAFIHEFLEYCLANNIKLDVLTWHDFRTGYRIPYLKDNLLQIRNDWVNSSRYAPLQIKAIHINEMIGETDQVNPAAILAFFDALEKGKADAACKACWNETSSADNNCFNNTLDGLLTPGTFKKRSAWWAYYYYALTVQKRYTTTSNDSTVVCFTSIPSNNNNQLLILGGYFGDPSLAPVKNISLSINNIANTSFLSGRPDITVSVSKIPYTGFGELTQPTAISSQQVAVINGKINITVPGIGLKDAFVIQIE